MTTAQAIRRAPAGVDPTAVAGLLAWLRADGENFQDSARTTPALADGDPVGSWSDLSGNGNHFSQATSTRRPLFKTAILNGRPVLRFDGVDDYLTRSAPVIAGTDDYTLFVIGRLTGGTVGEFFAERSTVNNAIHANLDRASGPLLRLLHRNNANNLLTLSTAGPAVGTWMILQGRSLALAHRFRLNGGVALSGNATAGATTPDNTCIGCLNGPTGPGTFLNGEIAEVILYDSGIPGSSLDLVGAYLESKYDLTWAPAA